VHILAPGTMYALTGHERHFLRAKNGHGDLQCICVFNPPIAGSEDHNAEGVYPVVDDHGASKFSISPDDIPRLFLPPESLRKGTADPVPAAAAATTPAQQVVTDIEEHEASRTLRA
jgi:hypothetical protein